MPAPPLARPGTKATNVGRDVVAGVGAYQRTLSARTSAYELWTPLRVLTTEDAGYPRLRKLHGSAFDKKAFRRFVAYQRQAEAYYLAAETMSPESRPLVGYYFVLNLTKAFLTCVDPALTAQRVVHGVGDAFTEMQRYHFGHERVRIQSVSGEKTSAFRALAHNTGAGFCYAASENLEIRKLAPYAVETADVFEDATSDPPKLVPATTVEVWSDGDSVWLRAEVDRAELRRRGLGPESLVKKARHFGSVFRLVQSDEPTASYESVDAFGYGKRILDRADDLQKLFGTSLVHVNRGSTGRRYLIILSRRQSLLSQEAVCFLMMIHLSAMVRYRPEQVAKLTTQKWLFLFTTWVPRAMENFYLSLASGILKEEIRIAE